MLDELIGHDTTGECPCDPTVIPVEGPDGEIGFVLVHHSWDVTDG